MRSELNLELKLIDGLRAFRDRVKEERTQRVSLGGKCLSFGVPFLDECLGGIYANDLVVWGSRSGIGKSQLATITAMTNAAAGKRVHFFALEAEPNEIERRIKYQVLAQLFFKTLRPEFPALNLNYMDWYYGRLDDRLGKYESEIDQMLYEIYPGLSTFYRESGEFTAADFQKKILAIQDQTDLIICDHLHYFDFEDENENRAMKVAVKQIRDVAISIGKPVILIAHLRKSDRKAKQVVPGLDEFHGSSDITKIATKVITLAPCPPDAQASGNRWPTYMRIAKCRVDGSRMRAVGATVFNADINQYEKPYFLGRLNYAEDEFEPIRSYADMPHWATNGQVAK